MSTKVFVFILLIALVGTLTYSTFANAYAVNCSCVPSNNGQCYVECHANYSDED